MKEGFKGDLDSDPKVILTFWDQETALLRPLKIIRI